MSFLLLSSAGVAPASSPVSVDIWVAQTAQGAGDGTTEANAYAVTFFNTESNWGSGAGQIDAGTVVGFTGTITTDLSVTGVGGASGNPVIVDGTNATMNAFTYFIQCDYITLQNFTWVDSFAGGELCAIEGGSNIIVDNFYADNYTGGGDGINAFWLGQDYSGGTSRPDSITIKNCYVRQAATDLGNQQHDIVKSEGSTNIIIEGNELHLRIDGTGANAHNDIIQTYESGSGSSQGGCENWTIRNNLLIMNCTEDNDRSFTILEGLSGTNYIYRNVCISIDGGASANCFAGTGETGATYNFYQNTLVTKSANNMFNFASPGTLNIRGNILCASGSQTFFTGTMTTNRSYNYLSGTSAPSPTTGEIQSTAANGADLDFTDYANNDFTLQSGSPAENAGSDFGSPYDTPLDPTATWPEPATTTITGNWDMGAYQR